MSDGYAVRLVLLCFASFYLLHLALGAGVQMLTPRLLRWTKGMRPRAASDWLLAMRLGPAAISLAMVLALCVPSYLRHEPYATEESTGAALPCLALLGVVIGGQALARTARALRQSWKGSGTGPVLRLMGIVAPRVVVSDEVRAALSEAQWEAVLRHEEAHRVSLDNLKRLLMLLTPGLAPLYRGWGRLESAWVEATEQAADAAAVDGDGDRAVALAESLVRLARLGLDREASAVESSFATDPAQLRARVECLLDGPPRDAGRTWILPVSGLALGVAVCMGQAWLERIHRLMELLVD